MIERVQFGSVVGPHGVVQAIPQFREFAGSIHHDAGAGIAGVGFTGAVAINADIKLMSGMRGTAFAGGRAGFLTAGRSGPNACVAAATKSLLGFRTGREGLETRSGILFHSSLSGRPIGKYTGLPPRPYHVKFSRHADSMCLQ